MAKPEVSIVTIAHNRNDLLKKMIATVKKNTAISYEFIIVANAPTPQVKKTCLDLSKKGFTVLFNEGNESYGRCNNQGAAKAKADLVCLINDDVFPRKGWLSAMMKTMQERNAGIVGAKLFFPDGRIQHIGVVFRPNLLPMHAFHGYEPRLLEPVLKEDSRQPVVTAACALIKKEIFDKTGGFDERFYYGLEDVDLFLRARELGYDIWLSAGAEAVHYEHASIENTSITRKSNVMLLLRKHWWSLLKKYPRILLGWRDYKMIEGLADNNYLLNYKLKKKRFWNLFQSGFNACPRRIIIEPTTRCNIKCIQCARHVDLRKQGDMSRKAFKELLPAMGKLSSQFGDAVVLNGNGESLLNKDFLWMLRQATKAAPSVGFTTNGMLVDDRIAKALVEMQLEEVFFSVDAASPKLFNKIRKGANFDRVMESIGLVVKHKRLLKSKKPLVSLLFVAMEMNIAELPKVVELASSLGAKKVKVTNLEEYNLTKDQSLVGRYKEPEFEPYFKEAVEIAHAKGIDLVLPFEDEAKSFHRAMLLLKREKLAFARKASNFIRFRLLNLHSGKVFGRKCHDPWEMAYIRWNGNVIPCCGMERVMGNVNNKGFDDVWFGEEYMELRKEVASSNPPKECAECLHRVEG